MRKKMQKYTAAMMAAILTLSAAGMSVSAEETRNIVVIGDSISAGAELETDEKSYVDIVSEYTGANVQNFAAEGADTQAVLNTLSDPQVQAALEEADVILVTAGIHDIMDPFMAKTDEYMTNWGFQKFADVFTAELADYGLEESDLNQYFLQLSKAISTNRDSAAANMLEIGEKLSAYPNAQVVIQNVYNSIDTIANLDELTQKRQTAYNTVCNLVSSNLNETVNTSITTMSENYGFHVIDVHAGFKGYAYKFANLDELDVNPTAEGHRWLAAEVLAVMGDLQKGDTNADKMVSALDAASVLMHAAEVGAGGTGTIGTGAALVSDVNGDAAVDSADASKILIYAAAEGSGETPSWD